MPYNGFAIIILSSHQETYGETYSKIQKIYIFKNTLGQLPEELLLWSHALGQGPGEFFTYVQILSKDTLDLIHINYYLIVFDRQEHLLSHLQLPIGRLYSSLMSCLCFLLPSCVFASRDNNNNIIILVTTGSFSKQIYKMSLTLSVPSRKHNNIFLCTGKP